MEIEQTTKGQFAMLRLMAQNNPSCLANRKIDTCPLHINLTARNPPQQTCKAQGKSSMETVKQNHNTCNDTGRNGGERRIGTIPAGTDAAPATTRSQEKSGGCDAVRRSFVASQSNTAKYCTGRHRRGTTSRQF